MSDQEFYNTIVKESMAEYRDRGSKFIAYAYPVKSIEDFKKQLDLVRKEHPKATHHCFAYRLGIDHNQFRVSDDGEPSGTAGRPILGQIDSKSLTDILIVVVRYFGGTLLGVPGLIAAYKTAASLVLQTSQIVQMPIEKMYILSFDYTMINEVMKLVKQMNCSVLNQDMNLFCTMTIGIPKSKVSEAIYRFEDLRNLEIKPGT